MLPTARTLAWLRRNGWEADVVERTIRGKGRTFRRDFLGCIDLIGVRADSTVTVGVQACAGASVSTRIAKSIAEPRLRTWLNNGGPTHRHFYVVGWRKVGERGKRKLWQPRIVEVYAQHDRLRFVETDGIAA